MWNHFSRIPVRSSLPLFFSFSPSISPPLPRHPQVAPIIPVAPIVQQQRQQTSSVYLDSSLDFHKARPFVSADEWEVQNIHDMLGSQLTSMTTTMLEGDDVALFAIASGDTMAAHSWLSDLTGPLVLDGSE